MRLVLCVLVCFNTSRPSGSSLNNPDYIIRIPELLFILFLHSVIHPIGFQKPIKAIIINIDFPLWSLQHPSLTCDATYTTKLKVNERQGYFPQNKRPYKTPSLSSHHHPW